MIGSADWPEMGRSGKKVSKSLSSVKDHKLNKRGIFQEKIVAARNGLVKRGKCKNKKIGVPHPMSVIDKIGPSIDKVILDEDGGVCMSHVKDLK